MRNTKLLQKKLERRDVFIAMMSERMGKATEWTIVIDGLPIENGDFPWQTVSHNQMVVAIPWGKLTVRCGKSRENDR